MRKAWRLRCRLALLGLSTTVRTLPRLAALVVLALGFGVMVTYPDNAAAYQNWDYTSSPLYTATKQDLMSFLARNGSTSTQMYGVSPNQLSLLPETEESGQAAEYQGLDAAAGSGNGAAETALTQLYDAGAAEGFLPAVADVASSLSIGGAVVGAFGAGYEIGRGFDALFLHIKAPDFVAAVGSLFGSGSSAVAQINGYTVAGETDCSLSSMSGPVTARLCAAVTNFTCTDKSLLCPDLGQAESGTVNSANQDPRQANAVAAANQAAGLLEAQGWQVDHLNTCHSWLTSPCNILVMDEATYMSKFHVDDYAPYTGQPTTIDGSSASTGTVSFTPDRTNAGGDDGTKGRACLDPSVATGCSVTLAPTSVALTINIGAPGTGDGADALNHAKDPTDYPHDPTSTTLVAPDCVGLTQVQCENAFAHVGWDGPETAQVVAPEQADVTQPAGAVIAQDPAGGATVPLSQPLTLSVNPDTMPLQLPAPGLNETYTDYLTRLQSLGFVGTITTTQLDPTQLDATVGPNAVSRVSVTTSTGAVVSLRPGDWPSPLPLVVASAPMTVTYNPASAAPVATGADGGPPADTGTPVPGAGGCTSGHVCFPPLNQVCDKFPFGVFCWIKDQISALVNQPAIPPSISMTIPSEHIKLFSTDYTTGSYTFGWDFGSTQGQAFDVYLDTIRTALSYLLWLGGLFYIGTRLLRIHGAPDPRVGDELNGEGA